MPNLNELWYAARKTQIIYMPHKMLETFGETNVHYSLLSQVEDGTVRLRSGVVKAARPRVITPYYLASQALENFGEEARKYFEDLLNRKEGAPILQYGLCFQKEDHAEQTMGGNALEVAEQIAKEAQDNLNDIRGVLIGSDAGWEVALIFFLRAMVAQSAPHNSAEMAGRGLFSMKRGIPMAVCNEIEQDFQMATTREQADKLGDKLREFGVFDDYEDRFFQLYSRFA